MEKKFEDDELDKLLKEQFIKEADMIEEALFSDENFEEFEETDEEVRAAYDKLVARLKADGIYREEDDGEAEEGSVASEADETAMEIGDRAETISAQSPVPEAHESKVIPMRGAEKRGEEQSGKKGHKIAKAAGFVVVATMCVFAASMTSEANRNYFINKVRYLAGNDTRIVFSNDENNDKSLGEEYEAVVTIEEQLNISLPEFMYRPDTFEFHAYELDSLAGFALLEYSYNNTIISMHVNRKEVDDESNVFSLHGQNIANTNLQEKDIKVSIFEVKDKQDAEPTFAAQWSIEKVYYQISGKMKKNEFINLIENMQYRQ